MENFKDLKEIADKLKKSTKKVKLIYAFNGTGKTRLSMEFKNLVNSEDVKKVIYYNAFTEDLFSWDNDLENDLERKMQINTNSYFINLVKNQGKENEISNMFKNLTSSKIEPNINIETGEISFNLSTGDENSINNIKISRGEERIFIWCMFFVLIDNVISELNKNTNERSTDEFNQIKYIFIDDPISSLDDNHCIDIALNLHELIKGSKEDNGLKFIISTHHAFFYNVLHNLFKSGAKKYILSKNSNLYNLKELKNSESPFGYHLILKDELQKAILSNNIKRYHFNLLRNLLEKTASFLGYEKWKDLIHEEDKESYVKRINSYSHSDYYSELDTKELEQYEKNFLKNTFEKFIINFEWKVEDNETDK